MNPVQYIYDESKRQSATKDETYGMMIAYLWLRPKPRGFILTQHIVLTLAHLINGAEGYRQVPAVFNQGEPAIPAQQVPRAMSNLCEMQLDEYAVDEIMIEFLKIHPFADGNGRVASLLYNWIRGTLENPDPLPYYFGEGSSGRV